MRMETQTPPAPPSVGAPATDTTPPEQRPETDAPSENEQSEDDSEDDGA